MCHSPFQCAGAGLEMLLARNFRRKGSIFPNYAEFKRSIPRSVDIQYVCFRENGNAVSQPQRMIDLLKNHTERRPIRPLGIEGPLLRYLKVLAAKRRIYTFRRSLIQAYVIVVFSLQLSAVFVLDMFLFVEPVLSKEIL